MFTSIQRIGSPFPTTLNEVRSDACSLSHFLSTQHDDVAKWQRSAQEWPLLGFENEAAFARYLSPTLEMLLADPPWIRRRLYETIANKSDFTHAELVAESYPPEEAADALSALINGRWAQWKVPYT